MLISARAIKEALNFLMLYSRRIKEEIPLFLVMVTALENKFVLVNITAERKSILVQIAFACV